MVSPNWLSRRCWRVYRVAICILGLTIALAACKSDRTPELLGTWQATMLVEEGDTVDVILDDVSLFFDQDGSYTYTSTLDYEESGTFRTRGDMLFTTPVKQDTLLERPVAIAFLNENSLHLNMKEGDKNRILKFERIVLSDAPEPSFDQELHHEHDGHDHGDELHAISTETLTDTIGVDEIND